MALLSRSPLQSHCQCSIVPANTHNGSRSNFRNGVAGRQPINVKLVFLPVKHSSPTLVRNEFPSASIDLNFGRKALFSCPQNESSFFSDGQIRAQTFSLYGHTSKSAVAFNTRARMGLRSRKHVTDSSVVRKRKILGGCLQNANIRSFCGTFNTHPDGPSSSLQKASRGISPSGASLRRTTERRDHSFPRFGGLNFGTPCCRKSGRRRGVRALGAAESVFALAGGVGSVESVFTLARGALGSESLLIAGGSLGNIGSVFTLAAQGPPAVDLQTVIIGGGAFLSIFASLYFGMKGEPVGCKACGGNGGTKCIFCENGKMRSDKGLIDCRVCRGAGLVLCRTCRGSGFSTRM